MKKIKLLTGLVGISGLSMGLVPMVTMSSCSKSSVELDKTVTDKNVSIKSFNIVKGQDSTIEFNLPSGRTLKSAQITVGDVEVTSANMVVASPKITIKAAAMTSNKVYVKGVTLSSSPTPVTAKAFAETEWSEIIEYITAFEGGILTAEQLCDKFNDVEYKSATEVADQLAEFIGKTHKITFNENENNEVRIIGVAHDTITGTSSKATFTFELVNLWSNKDGSALTSKWDTTNNQSFPTSTLCTMLNNSANPQSPYSQLNTLFGSNKLKQVNKQVAQGTSYDVQDYPTMPYVFPLTYTEMSQTSSEYVKVEGTAYKYWTINNNNKARIKKDVNGDEFSYWLASPNTNNNGLVLGVFKEGDIKNNFSVVNTPGISFAFCI